MVLPVLSQRTYPGVGDIDDCWVIATIWSAASSRPTIKRPTTTTFRAYAGVPDVPGQANGGNIWDCNKGADGCWPTLPNELMVTPSWDLARTYLHSGKPCSVALDSARLPTALRYNFFGKHQVGIVWDGTRYRFMNPLAPDGSTPPAIAEAALKWSMAGLVSPASYRFLAFPKPKPGVLWGWDVAADIQAAYSVGKAGTALQRVGVDTYGDRINDVDLEAGCKAAGINYGTSIQLTDVTALLKKTGVI